MKSKNVAVIFNTNQLGGAERSLIEQLAGLQSEASFTLLIPQLGLPGNEIKDFFKQKGFNDCVEYSYPSYLYKLSRKDYHKIPIALLTLPGFIRHLLKWNSIFSKFSEFYVNGNKAILPVLAWSVLSRRKIKVIWHFRDFPSPRAFKILGRVLINPIFRNMSFKIVANSYAVADDLKKYFPKFEIECLYNLAGTLPEKKVSSHVRHIGIVSMLAPWKGLHSVVLMAKLYEEELKSIGIEKISFYGDAIYQTGGEHQNYPAELKELCRKLNVHSIEFRGKVPPSKIFSEIDLLIHSSLQPEPFGRVILEAFKSNVPVISTGIGGASELIGEKNACGLKYDTNDYAGLFQCIKDLSENPLLREDLIKRAHHKAHLIENQVTENAKSLLIELLRR